jgi:hypothetical protein
MFNGWLSSYDYTRGNPDARKFHEDDKDGIRALLMGRTVTKVDDHRLHLDDGTELIIDGNEGGCSCGAGDYELTELNECPNNAVMAVEFEDAPIGDEYSDWDGRRDTGHYRIFVLAEDRRIKLAEFEGSDGNGYYGTGYWIVARPIRADAEVTA